MTSYHLYLCKKATGIASRVHDNQRHRAVRCLDFVSLGLEHKYAGGAINAIAIIHEHDALIVANHNARVQLWMCALNPDLDLDGSLV